MRRVCRASLLVHLIAGSGTTRPRLGPVTATSQAPSSSDPAESAPVGSGGPLSRLPLPSMRLQKGLALANVFTQIGIMTTGVLVRVTASGLGCETWPKCNQDSFVPVPGAGPAVHQAIEFGNRLLTFVLVAVAAALILALLRAGRRKGLILLSLTMPVGILAQAVIGGITVLAGLIWWTVALHLLPSMVLAWLAAVLFVRVGERDDASPRQVVPTPLRWLTILSTVLLAGVLATGTMVTGAGPHAGDARIGAADRLQLPIQWLVHFHAELMVGYVCLLIGLVAGLIALKTSGPAIRRAWILIGMIAAQAVVGIVQYWLGVPELLVILHVTLAGAITAVTGALWAAGVIRDRADA
ncbi:MAG: heme A synthase [Actinomycetales bacterium]|nr:heme A synthase [Actinomycetales bacterium]